MRLLLTTVLSTLGLLGCLSDTRPGGRARSETDAAVLEEATDTAEVAEEIAPDTAPIADTAVPPAPSTVRLRFEPGYDIGVGCFAFSGVDAQGKQWLAEGDPDTTQPSIAEATAAGGHCQAVVAGFELVRPCTPNLRHEVTFALTGLFDGTASVGDESDDYYASCAPGSACKVEFFCSEGVETTVDLAMEVTLSAHQSFVDIAVNNDFSDEHDHTSCYALRVVNSAPEPNMIWGSPEICSSQYGNGRGGDITFIGTCDYDHPETKVTLWLTSMSVGDSAAGENPEFVDPCPVPDDAGPDISTWTGGCTRIVRCIEGVDTPVEFNLFGPDAVGGF